MDEIKNELKDDVTPSEISKFHWKKKLQTGLTALPIKEHGFILNKQAFWDSLYLRSNTPHQNLPAKCVCNKPFTVEHALSCHREEFIIIRHNEIRDFTAELLAECHNNVQVEPNLSPLTGKTFPASTITTDEARVDIAACGGWIKGKMGFFDVRVFNPTAKTYLKSSSS